MPSSFTATVIGGGPVISDTKINYTKIANPSICPGSSLKAAFEDALEDEVPTNRTDKENIAEVLNIKDGNKGFVYPNPTKGIVNIDLGNEQITRFTITDALGHILKSKEIKGENRFVYDISGYQNGFYFLVISSHNSIKRIKIIKQ